MPRPSRALLLGARAVGERAALQVDEQQRDGRRRDALDAGGLADVLGTVLAELLLHFLRQPAYRGVVQVGGQRQRFLGELARDIVSLPVDVAGVLGGDLDLLGDGLVLDSLASIGERQQ